MKFILAFQSTHPRGVRRVDIVDTFHINTHFNPRTREGCDAAASPKGAGCLHFNPRTREGCDADLSGLDEDNAISIHAPARGATNLRSANITEAMISIHAPARGATSSPSWSDISRRYFNPRTREGCD